MVVSANINSVTEGCRRPLSVCEPVVVSLTPTTNRFPHPSVNISVHFGHSHDELQTVPVFGVSPGCVGASATCNVLRDEGLRRAKPLSETDCAPTQLWEPPLTIWWHLDELFVSVTLFNLMYFCFGKKYIYVYSPNGIWICAMDKYLRPRWKVIHQVYDGFSGCGGLHQNSWWDFLNFVSSSLFIFGWRHRVFVAFGWIQYTLLHVFTQHTAQKQLKWNATSHLVRCWIWSTLHQVRVKREHTSKWSSSEPKAAIYEVSFRLPSGWLSTQLTESWFIERVNGDQWSIASDKQLTGWLVGSHLRSWG